MNNKILSGNAKRIIMEPGKSVIPQGIRLGITYLMLQKTYVSFYPVLVLHSN